TDLQSASVPRNQTSVWLGKLRQYEKRTVVSGDSDLLVFKSVDSLLRPVPKAKSYALFERKDVLKALGFQQHWQLELLAIVNRSDFAMNVPGIGLAKSTALIVSLDESLTVQEKGEMFVQETNKRRLKDKDPATAEQFRISIRIFHDIQDTPMGVRQQTASDISDFLERIQYLQHLKDQRIQVARANHFQRSQIPFHQPNRPLALNPYRPIFSSADAMLKSKTISMDTVMTCPPCPPPPDMRSGVKKPHVIKSRRKKKKPLPTKQKTRSFVQRDPGTPKRNLTVATKDEHALRRAFKSKSLDLGSVMGSAIKNGMDKDIAWRIAQRIQMVTEVLNDVERRAYECVALYISHLLPPPSAESSLQSSSSTSCSSSSTTPVPPPRPSKEIGEKLSQMVSTDRTFYNNLGRLLLTGELGDCSGYLEAFELYRNLITQPDPDNPTAIRLPNFSPPNKDNQLDIQSNCIRPTMNRVRAAIRQHFVGAVFDVKCPRAVDNITHFFEQNASDKKFADFPTRNRHWTGRSRQPLIINKGALISTLFLDTTNPVHVNGYNWRTRTQYDQNPEFKDQRFVLRGSISTNGLQVHLLAFDTEEKKETFTTSSRTLMDDDDDDDEDDDDFDEDVMDQIIEEHELELDQMTEHERLELIEREDTPKESSASADPKGKRKAVCEEYKPKKKSLGTVAGSDSTAERHIDSERGSKMLPNVVTTFKILDGCYPHN
ncbi:hypothetical protein BG004_005749, partial [Podila humilis]